MKVALCFFMAGLLLTINSCVSNHCCENDSPVRFSKYFIGDSCKIAKNGTYIIEKSEYERLKHKCDEIVTLTIHQEDFIKDTFEYRFHEEYFMKNGSGVEHIPASIDTLHYLEFVLNKENFKKREQSYNIINKTETNGIFRIELLKNIDLCDVDYIILEEYLCPY